MHYGVLFCDFVISEIFGHLLIQSKNIVKGGRKHEQKSDAHYTGHRNVSFWESHGYGSKIMNAVEKTYLSNKQYWNKGQWLGAYIISIDTKTGNQKVTFTVSRAGQLAHYLTGYQ